MNSPTHRDNLVNAHYTDIGIGMATGTYEGHPATFVVQLFGRPAQPVVAVIPTAAAPRPGAPIAPILIAAAPVSTSTPVPALISPATTTPPTSVSTSPVTVASPSSVPPAAVAGTEIVMPNPHGTVVYQSEPRPSLIARLISSPRTAAEDLYLALAALVAVALLLVVLVKVKNQRPALVMNGILLLILIASAFVLNNYIALASAAVN